MSIELKDRPDTKALDTGSITVEQSAIDRIKAVRAREKLGDEVKLRVAVVGGGCSGFKYAMGLTDEQFEDDRVFGDHVVIDESSLEILNGSTISYQDHLTGAQFVIDNPNVASGCGCGNSFAVKD